jgi:hypothetical protein
MKRALSVILPLLILSAAASFAQKPSDSESDAYDFIKELNAASKSDAEPAPEAKPEPKPESKPTKSKSKSKPSAPKPVAADDGLDEEGEAGAGGSVAPKPVLSDEERLERRQALIKTATLCTAIGLDALGVGLFSYGISENGKVAKYTKKTVGDDGKEYYKDIKMAQKAATNRNVAYFFGSLFLASGITIHILF